MQEGVIHEDEGHHGFGDWRGSDAHAGIMAAIGFNGDRLATLINRPARDANAGCRLDADGDDYILAGRNAAENAASMVGHKTFGRQFVAMFGSALSDGGEA